jgi:tetratricopeptide (TPR) repeat protein
VVAALLFALHPLNVEAISWISGRTDPLAALFTLSACLLWMRWLDNPKWPYAVCSLFLFGAGILTKESAVAFLPVYLLLVLAWPALPPRRRVIAAGGICLSVVVVVVVIALIWKSGIASYGRFLAGNSSAVTGAVLNSLVAFGFYVKKMLLPLPLNFAITEVNPAYALLGILSFIVLVAAFVVWRLNALFFAATALMILPALAVATKQIAWTPLAERYMYMPTAFLCLGTSCLLFSLQKKNLNRIMPLILTVVCMAGVVSFQRNLLWKDKLAFFQDAVAKSPGFGSVYNELGGMLLQERQFDKAAEAFAAADRLNKRPSMKMLIKSNIMATLVAKGSLVTARDYFFQLFGEKHIAPVEFLEILYVADCKRLESLEKGEKLLLAHDLLETLGLLYLKKPDPFWHYRSGQIALFTGNNTLAANFFRKAYVAAPVDAYYKAAAKTYYLRLEAGK